MKGKTYSVFLSYNSEDYEAVEQLAKYLTDKARLKPWFDKWILTPGESWVEHLEQGLKDSASCAVFVGKSGKGPWQMKEVETALRLQVKNSKFRVIPVLLPEASKQPKLPLFLSANIWVDFRHGLDDDHALWCFECGIKGKSPGRGRPNSFSGSTTHLTHPFIYGRPVNPDKFINRTIELSAIFNRLRNSESTAIVGMPHIGKSSLLLKLADAATQRHYLGNDLKRLIVSLLDLHPAPDDYNTIAFWEDALKPLRERLVDKTTSRYLEQAVQDGYTHKTLDRLFQHLNQQNRIFVLLLDEFDRLLFHPKFQNPAFFTLLRSLSTLTGGLVLVCASRLSVAEMNELGQGLLNRGSPFFNHMIDISLRPFDEDAVKALLDQGRDILSAHDRLFIRRVAGCNPFMLSAMAATLIETKGKNNYYSLAAEKFYERISFHFDDLWHTLDDRTRGTAIISSMLELGCLAFGKDFDHGKLKKVKAFDFSLRHLIELGLMELASKGWHNFFPWRRQRLTMASQAFLWWIRDVAITETRKMKSYNEWITNKRYLSLLTEKQWTWLVGKVRSTPKRSLLSAAALAQSLIDELIKKSKDE